MHDFAQPSRGPDGLALLAGLVLVTLLWAGAMAALF